MFDALAVCYAYSDARRQGFRARLWLAVVLVASLPGFMIYLVYSASKTGDWKRATLPMAYTFEAVLISLAALASDESEDRAAERCEIRIEELVDRCADHDDQGKQEGSAHVGTPFSRWPAV